MPRLLTFFLIICLGCNQSEEPQIDDLSKVPDYDFYFQFGTVGGLCTSPCNVAYRYDKNGFFENTNPQNPTDFSKAILVKLPPEKAALVNMLWTQFPKELVQFESKQFGTSKVIVDGQDYVVELKVDKNIYRWQMPSSFDRRDNVPDYVRLFQRRIGDTLTQLKKI